MEDIIRRALTVAIICTVGYGAILLADSNSSTDRARQVMTQEALNQTERISLCAGYPPAQQPRCRMDMSFYSPAYYEAQRTIKQASADENTGWNFLVIGIFLWPAYLLIRWIITGQSKPEEEEEEN